MPPVGVGADAKDLQVLGADCLSSPGRPDCPPAMRHCLPRSTASGPMRRRLGACLRLRARRLQAVGHGLEVHQGKRLWAGLWVPRGRVCAGEVVSSLPLKELNQSLGIGVGSGASLCRQVGRRNTWGAKCSPKGQLTLSRSLIAAGEWVVYGCHGAGRTESVGSHRWGALGRRMCSAETCGGSRL
jgi:hypothetical protein